MDRPRPPRVFYRIIGHHEPTLWDFTSNFAKGRPPRGVERTDPAEHRGISVYALAEDALHTAFDYPKLGDFLAELVIPADDPETSVRKTGSLVTSHHTLWGEPARLLGCVRTVLPIVRPAR
jgi:hypothetical protein